MVINKEDAIYIYDAVRIDLSESSLIKLEDAFRNKKEVLAIIDASHYGFFNGNSTIYRHDTVKCDIPSFIYPKPKPIIEKHKLGVSDEFGKVIAADYKLTDFYYNVSENVEIEGLSTEEYINLCKDSLIPLQRANNNYNGLAYVQVIGRINHKEGVRKVLEKEFFNVSIGAKPKKLICSECLQDQVVQMCRHYGDGVSKFLLAESLEYDELSFTNIPADPFGRVVRIQDGKMEETIVEYENKTFKANVDFVYAEDFFKEITDQKKAVCVNNICEIINSEEKSMKVNTINLSQEKPFCSCKSIKHKDEEFDISAIELKDEEITDKEFAIIQNVEDGIKRRLPLKDEICVKLSAIALKDAEDLTDEERKKAESKIKRVAKTFNIEKIEDYLSLTDVTIKKQEIETKEEEEKEEVRTLDVILDELKTLLSKDELRVEDSDLEKNPVAKIYELLKWFADDFAWAGKSLNEGISSYLEGLGKEVVSKGVYDELQKEINTIKDELKAKDEDIVLLEDQNRILNRKVRLQMVDEILSAKDILHLSDEDKEECKNKLLDMSFESLNAQLGVYRELILKLNDSQVINKKKEISVIADPTLQDSLVKKEETEDNGNKKEEFTEKDLLSELKKLFK